MRRSSSPESIPVVPRFPCHPARMRGIQDRSQEKLLEKKKVLFSCKYGFKHINYNKNGEKPIFGGDMRLDEYSVQKDLKEIRKQTKIQQKKIAHLSSISQGDLSKFENEKLDIRLSTLEKIAAALDMKIMAIPKSKFQDITLLLELEENQKRVKDKPLTLLEKYRISDDEE